MLSKGLCQATRPRPGHEAAPRAAEGRGGARAAQAPALAGQEVSFQEAGTAQGVRFSHAHPPRGKHPSWHKQDGRVGRGKSNRRRGPEAPEHPQQGSGAPVSSAAWGAMHCDVSESRAGLGRPTLELPPPLCTTSRCFPGGSPSLPSPGGCQCHTHALPTPGAGWGAASGQASRDGEL